ncbi:MAG TPA: TonB-dependent receptor [Saprospiraceae bacterium]|nr:TonB-dependent receptor [Saprospiraceae bacterium]
MKNLILTLVTFLLCLSANGQTTISGMIKDDKGEALSYANVYLENSFDGTSSNDDGSFSFTTSEKGKQTLVVDFLGFKQSKKEININEKAISVQFVMKEEFNRLKAVTVTAGTFEAGDKKKAAVLKPLDIVTTAGAMGDIGNALQTLPGTTTVGESGRLYVRGGSSEETQTYIDGMHVPVAYTSGTPNNAVRGRFNPFLFKGTVFNTGGYSAEYGQALSSVLLLSTKDFQVKDRLDISLMSIGLSLAGTKVWNKTAVTATLDYMNLDPYFKLAKQRVKINEAWNSLSGAISLRQKTGDTGMLKLYVTNNNSKTNLDVFDFEANDNYTSYATNNTNLFVNASWKGSVGDKWILRSGISYTKDNNKIAYGEIDLSNQLSELHMKANASFFIQPKISLKFGAEQIRRELGQEIFTNDLTDTQSSSFAETNIYLSKKFVLRLGARLEYIDRIDELSFSPRFSSAYMLNENSQISFAYGKYFQNPNDRFAFLTPNLQLEQANHFILNYQVEKNKRLLRAEVYYKNYDNLLQYEHAFNPSTFQQNGDGYATGLDIFYRDLKTIKNSKFWISYSYLLSERNYQDFPEKSTPNFVAKHHVSLVYKYWLSQLRSYIGATITYSSPRVYNNPNLNTFNSEKTKHYKSVNLSWSYLPYPKVVVFSAVTNVFGFKNSYGYQYSQSPDNNGNYASHEILPTSDRFFFIGCFITLSKTDANQIDQLN